MDFFETIETRRSVRKYHAEPVPESVIEKAIDAALLAPNSSNMQPWEFYWVRSEDKRRELVDACFRQAAARTAGELVVAVARRDTWRRNLQLMREAMKKYGSTKLQEEYYRKVVPAVYVQGPFSILGIIKYFIITVMGWFRPVPRGPFSVGELFTVLIKTTALACENFMLAVAAQGYGSCPMEGFDERRVKKILGLGRRSRVVMCIGVGVPDPSGIYGERVRFERELFVHEV